MCKISAITLENKVRHDVDTFLKDRSTSPVLKGLYINRVIHGMDAYLGLIKSNREQLQIQNSLFLFKIGVFAEAGTYRLSYARAVIQGANYINELLCEILRKKGRYSETDFIQLDSETLQEAEQGYNKLRNLMGILVLENDPRIVMPGERLNFEAIRPKKPEDASYN